MQVSSHQTSNRERLKLNVNGITIEDDRSIKILGWWITPDGKLFYHLNKIRGHVYRTISQLKPFLKNMNLDQRRQVVYAKALSIAEYGLPLYCGQVEAVKDKLTTIFMRANRAILHQPVPLKTKNKWICRQIKVKSPRQLILEAGAKLIHRIVNQRSPPQIYEQLTFPRLIRKTARIGVSNVPRTQKCKRSTIYQVVKIFNNLPNNLKFVPPKLFKKLISKRSIQEIPTD